MNMNETRTRILIGTSGWTYDRWKEYFYPQGYPKSQWFEYYAARFLTVEINATFHRTFKDQTYKNWYERAPSNREALGDS